MQHLEKRSTLGLTLIEILVALALMGVLVSFVVSSLAGSFQITRENRKSLDATTTAQRIIEDIRGQWRDAATYNTKCATLTLNPANAAYMTLTATSAAMNATTTTVGTAATITGACGALKPATPCDSAMKRVIVKAVDSNDTTRILALVTLDIACPAV